MRISDWSSDVCSSDLMDLLLRHPGAIRLPAGDLGLDLLVVQDAPGHGVDQNHLAGAEPSLGTDLFRAEGQRTDRKSVVSGKSVSVSVDLGGRRIIKKKKKIETKKNNLRQTTRR